MIRRWRSLSMLELIAMLDKKLGRFREKTEPQIHQNVFIIKIMKIKL